jgi:sugar phosphate isomerase/epimerase
LEAGVKLSCLPVSFFDDILAGRMLVGEWARLGGEVGLDAIDLSILFIPDRSLAQAALLRRQIEDAGMRVAMVTSYPDFTHPDPIQRRAELALEEQVVALSAELGAELVRVTAGQAHPHVGRDEGIAWAVEGLTRLAECTADSAVRLAYENHAKPGAWRYTDFSQPPDIFLEIVRQTAAANLGVNFDAGNAAAFAEDPRALLRAVRERIISLHASDTATRGELRHVLLGTGLTPYADLFGDLRRSHWDGWICIEEASRQGREGVAAAVDFVRRAWQAAAA